MNKYKPVSIPNAAFIFCRYSIAVLIWLSFLLKIKWILIIVFLIFLFSAILKIKKAPMILLYSCTINKIKKSRDVVLNEKAMCFAHSIGCVFSFVAITILYFVNEKIGWGFVFLLAILKTISALGFCPASKLFDCATSDGCCAFIKK